jgi:hypothetical protein
MHVEGTHAVLKDPAPAPLASIGKASVLGARES